MPLLNWLKTQLLEAFANTSNPTKGDALIGVKQPHDNAVPRTVHDKLGECISVKDFGARGDGTGDDGPAIQAAVDSFGDQGGAVYFPPGLYEIKTGVRIRHSRLTLQGAGRHATHLQFNPVADHQTLFKFEQEPIGLLWQCAIRDMALVSSGSTHLTKTAIELMDTSNIIVRDLIIGPWTGNGDSRGLAVYGREAGQINNLHIQADRPLVIGNNPNNPGNALDHFHFSDLYLLVSSGVQQACIFIEDGAQLQNVVFDGFQAWVLGSYGLYWRDTTTTAASLALTLKNVRTEQNTDPNGYSVYIHTNAAVSDLLIENMVCDPYQRGFFFRNINRVTLRHNNYNGFDVGLDVDEVAELFLDQSPVGTNATVSMPNMQEKIAFNRQQAASPVPDTAYFIREVGSNPSQALHLFGGTKLWSFNGTLADGEELTVPAGNNQGRKAALIFVSAVTADGQSSAGGQVMDTAKEAFRLSGTDNFGLGSVEGKLTVFHTAATTISNHLGQAVDLVVFVVWM